MNQDSPKSQTNEKKESTFRQEAAEAEHRGWLGDVIFAHNISFNFMATFAGVVIISVASLGYLGSYTKTNTVTGEVEPDVGVAKIYPPESGFVIEQFVKEGEIVKEGAPLFLISDERISQQGETQAQISSDAKARKNTLSDEMEKTSSILTQDREGLQKKIANFKQEISSIDEMIAIQQQRVAVAQDIADRYQQLLQGQFVSDSDVKDKLAELLDERSKLESLQQNKISSNRDLTEAITDLVDLPLKTATNLAEIKQEFDNADADFSESEGKRRSEVVATREGIVTGIMVQVGQQVQPEKPLVSIIPLRAKFQAELYASSKEIGFVKVGDPVEIRFEAYPYQQYGSYSGTVGEIAKSPMTPSELAEIGDLISERSDESDRDAPIYRITVELDTQFVRVNGKQQRLQAGMLLQADVVQDTRRLYQWILEPMYSLDLPDFAK